MEGSLVVVESSLVVVVAVTEVPEVLAQVKQAEEDLNWEVLVSED